jgi:hypothetical protein
VLKANQPYVHTFYEQLDHQNTVVIFAVGEKDMGTRFAMNNVDPQTGLDMKVRPNKETGEFDAKYYQMINSMKDAPQTMDKRGYLFEVPNQKDVEGEVESASAFRNALTNSPDKESAKEVFEKQFKDYSEAIFNLVYDNIVGEKMSEDLNILKKLAGLDVDESAPVEFESNVEVNDIEFTPPSKSSSFHSIANRFPKGADVNDMDIKREEFINALVRSPANLLSEINERISPSDENGLAASEKLNKIISIVEKDGKNLTDLDDDDKSFAIKLVKKAIKEMELNAGDDSEEYDKEELPKESVDLSDIKSDYGIEEEKRDTHCSAKCCGADVKAEDCGCSPDCEHCNCNAKLDEGRMSDIHQAANEMDKEEFAKEHPEFADDWESMQNDDDAEDEPRDDDSPAYKKYIGKHKHDESVNESEPDEGSISDMDDDDLMAYVGQKEEELIDDMQQHIAPDFLHKDNYEETFEKYRDEVLEPAAEEVSADKNADDMAGTDYDSDDFVDNHNMVGDDEINQEESIEDTSNKALEAAMEELKKLSGIEEGSCPKCGNKKHKLMACSSCGCS